MFLYLECNRYLINICYLLKKGGILLYLHIVLEDSSHDLCFTARGSCVFLPLLGDLWRRADLSVTPTPGATRETLGHVKEEDMWMLPAHLSIYLVSHGQEQQD